jgi:hypothetical protein
MEILMRHFMCAVLIGCIPCLASCSPVAEPAAPVPTHVLTQAKAGSLTLAEQGDFIEVRLEESKSASGTWRLLRQSGSAHVESLGPATLMRDKTGTKRVFRFRAVRIGTLELAFVFQAPNKTPRTETVVAFNFTIK